MSEFPPQTEEYKRPNIKILNTALGNSPQCTVGLEGKKGGLKHLLDASRKFRQMPNSNPSLLGEIILLVSDWNIYPVFKVVANPEIKLICEVVISVLKRKVQPVTTGVGQQQQTLMFKGKSWQPLCCWPPVHVPLLCQSELWQTESTLRKLSVVV